MNPSSSDPSHDPPRPEAAIARSGFGGRAADALRHWEPRRVLYNLSLAAVVFGHLRRAVLATGAFGAVLAHFISMAILA